MNPSLLVGIPNRLGRVALLLTLAMLLSAIAPVLGGTQASASPSNAHGSSNSLVPSSHESLARTPALTNHGRYAGPTASELPAIGSQKERSTILPNPLSTGTSGERGTSYHAGPANSSNPYYFQEGATFSQFDGSTVTFTGWYFNVTLVTSTYPVGFEFNGLSNTGDWWQVLVGDNWPGCNAGFEMLYAYWNNTGKNSGGTWCDPSVTLSAGNNVALWMYVDTNVFSLTYSDVCLEVYDWTTGKANSNTDCFAQPDPGGTPASNYFVTLSSSANANGFFSGPMTEVIDKTATSCITYGSMPTVSYQWASSTSGNLYVSKYIPWSDQFQAGASLCYVYDSPAITISPNYHGSIYTQAAPSYGPHWESSTNVSTIADVWNFVTDQTPVSPATTTVTGSRANADIGQSVMFTPTTTGGTSPYTYSWYLDNVFQTTTSGSWTLTASVAGTHSVIAYTQSSGGNTYGPSPSASVAVWSDPTVGTPSASPGSGGVDVGQSVTFTSALPTGGYGSYSYSWGGLPTGCTNSGTSKDLCTPTAGGTSSVVVTVTDSDSFPATSPLLSYTVDPSLGVTLSTDKSLIDLGQSFNLTSTPSGGSGTYSYLYSGLPAGCTNANALTLLCKPASKGVFNVSVTATDTNTAQATSTPLITITVDPALVVSAFTASPNPIPDGGTSYLNVTVSGGSAPLTYTYTGLPSSCVTANSPSITCTPTTAGVYLITVSVKDSLGMTVSSSAKVTVTGPTVSSFTATPSPVNVGNPVTFGVSVSGGATPYNFAYAGLPPGCATTNLATFSCTPSSSGSFNVTVTVTDANGNKATRSTLLTVNSVSGPAITAFTASPNPVTVSTATTLSVTVSGGTTPYTYAYTGLPPGCASSNTASLSCTPTATGSYNVTVTVTDANSKTATSTTALTVNSVSVPTITVFAASPNPVAVNTATTLSVTVSGGTTPYTYAYTGLPSGCTSSSTASLSCTPTATGSYTVTVTVTDANSKTATKSINLTVNAVSGPTVTAFTASPNPVTVNATTSFSVTVTGGTSPYSYLYKGLPPGCTAANVATLSCTPTATGSYNVTVTVTDANSMTATKTTTLTVNAVSGPTVAAFTASPNPVTVSTATTLSVTVSGGTTPYTYAYTGLPAGCTSSNTASLSCTPTVTGSFNVTVTVTDANSKTATKSITLTVSAASAPVVTAFSASPNPVSVNSATTFSVTVSGGTAPYSYAYTGLPSGCTTANVATLSCAPTAAGSFNVTVTVTDANSKSASKTTMLVVNSVSAPTITAFAASSNPDLVNSPTTFVVSVSGGKSPYTYVYAGLPPGCTSSNTASLSCTPTSTGVFNVSVTVTDSQGLTATSYTVLKVIPASPSISSFSVSPASVSVGQSATFSATVTGGTPPYTYVYSGLPSGCTSSNKSTLSCSPSVSGNFTVTLSVTDSAGRIATPKNTVLQVTPSQGPTISAFTVTPNPVTVGSSVVFTVTAAGGSAPYTYSYVGLPNGCSSSSTSTLTCTPKTAGTYNVSVSVIDSKSLQVSDTINLTVKQALGGPTVASFLPSPDPAAVGQSVIFSVVVSGGTAPFSYSYTGLPPGCSSANTNTLSCTPSSPGNYTVSVLVSDKTGKTAAKSTLLVVTGVVKPLSVTLTSNLTSMSVGSSVELSAIVNGGVGPFSFVWMVNGGNQSATQNSTWDDAITQVGAYNFTVWVRDAKGNVAESQVVTVEVTGLTQSAPQAFPWWILLVVIAAVAVGMLLYMRERRRKDAKLAHSARDGETGMMGEETSAGIMPAGILIDTPSPLEPHDTGVVEPFPAPYATAPEPPVAAAPEGETSGEVKTEVQPVFYDTSSLAEVASIAPLPQEEPIVAPREEIPDEEAVGPIPTETFSEPLPPPAEPPEDEPEKPLTECPQCMGTLTPELYCLVCSVGWVREEKPSESTLDSPSEQDLGIASPQTDSTATSGTLEPAHAENHGAEDIEAELKAAERRRREEAQSSGEGLKGPSGDLGAAPVLDSEATPVGSSITQGKNCFVCGGPLKEDYCSVCDMHWESASPS